MDYDFALQCLGVELEKVVREHKKVLEKFKEERMSDEYYVERWGAEKGWYLRPIDEKDWAECTGSNTGHEYVTIYRKIKPKPYTETITWYPYPECVEEMGLERGDLVLLKWKELSGEVRVHGTIWQDLAQKYPTGIGVPNEFILAVARTPKGESCQS